MALITYSEIVNIPHDSRHYVIVQTSALNIQERFFVLTDRFCRHQRRNHFPMSSEQLTTFLCIPSRRRTNNPTALNAVSGKLRGCSLLSDALDVSSPTTQWAVVQISYNTNRVIQQQNWHLNESEGVLWGLWFKKEIFGIERASDFFFLTKPKDNLKKKETSNYGV